MSPPIRFQFKTALLSVALCALLAVAPPPAKAKEHIYTIRGVAVDATARTASLARRQALADGHSQAFNRLMARFVPRDRLAEVPPQSPGAIAALVGNFEVEEEKSSSVRYLARLTFRFNRRAVRAVLRTAGLPFAESGSRPLLVLPVFRSAGLNLLWDKPNPWLAAWSAMPLSEGLVPLVVPSGDLVDVAAISAEQALEGAAPRLSEIAGRYKAAGVMVAVATLGRDPSDDSPVLQVALIRHGAGEPAPAEIKNFRGAPETSTADMMAAAARATEEGIQEEWKRENLLRFDRQNELTVIVPLRKLTDWVRTERALRRVSVVQSSTLVSLSRRRATVRLRYLGEQSRLKLALARRDLHLEEGAADWTLRYEKRGRGATRR